MAARDRTFGKNKGDRALELFEKGLDSTAIIERLGCRMHSLHTLLDNARARREKLAVGTMKTEKVD